MIYRLVFLLCVFSLRRRYFNGCSIGRLNRSQEIMLLKGVNTMESKLMYHERNENFGQEELDVSYINLFLNSAFPTARALTSSSLFLPPK